MYALPAVVYLTTSFLPLLYAYAYAFVYSRNMGMGPRWLTKNKYVEEWNGRREITEKAFNATGGNVANIVFYAAVLPLGVYWLGRSELEKQGDRRYKDMC